MIYIYFLRRLGTSGENFKKTLLAFREHLVRRSRTLCFFHAFISLYIIYYTYVFKSSRIYIFVYLHTLIFANLGIYIL